MDPCLYRCSDDVLDADEPRVGRTLEQLLLQRQRGNTLERKWPGRLDVTIDDDVLIPVNETSCKRF